MRLLCFECHKPIEPSGYYFEVKVLVWQGNRGTQTHGYVYHPEHFPPSGGTVVAQVT